MSRSRVVLTPINFWSISSTGRSQFCLSSRFALGAILRCSSIGIVSIFLVSWHVIGSGSSFACHRGSPIMSQFACWLRLRLRFLLKIPAWRFLQNTDFFSYYRCRSLCFCSPVIFHVCPSRRPGSVFPCVWGCHGVCWVECFVSLGGKSAPLCDLRRIIFGLITLPTQFQ